MKSSGAALLFVAGIAIGGAAGWLAGSSAVEDEVERLEQELDTVETARADAEQRAVGLTARLEGARGATRRAEGRGSPDIVEAEVAPEVAEAPAPAAVDPAVEAARRAGRVAELQGKIDDLFATAKGEEAIELMKELAGILPEGREPAMELAVMINQDVQGAGKLKLSQMTFYGQLGDPAVKSLMQWSLEDPENTENSDFRVISAWSLPWTQTPGETTERFTKALGNETSFDVQQALIMNLSRMKKPEADRALREMLEDPNRSGLLRARVATELIGNDDPAIQAAIQAAADGDSDPEVRSAARAALISKNPPATGYLVTGTTPESRGQAAGFRPGDIMVSYGDQAITNEWGLWQATRESEKDGAAEPVKVVVMRDGGEVELLVQSGNLGVYGRGVKAAKAQ